MDHDALLKSIVHSLSNRVIPLLTGSRAVAQLNVEFNVVAKRMPDLVARLADGRILHLELQTTNDRRMPWRMLEYWLLLVDRFPAEKIVQMVLYVGYAKLRMPTGYSLSSLHYRYTLVDIRRFDAAELLASSSPTERILAILCESANVRETIRKVLNSWQGSGRRELASLLKKLMIVSRLRKLEKSVTKEYQTMPLTIDLILKNEVFREWMEKGMKEGRKKGVLEGRKAGVQEGRLEGLKAGEATVLRRLVERRFGRLPAWAAKRIETADTKLLEKWALQLLDAETIEEVFA